MQRAVAALLGDDLQHVFGRQRLEVEPVRGVVVGRHRLRIAIDHDGLVAGLFQREAGMAAAIVELDALADAVRPAAEDDDLLAVRRRALVRRVACERRLVGRVHVGRGRGEFRRAGVDALEHRAHVELVALGGGFRLGQAGENRKPGIGKAHGLQRAHAERMRRQAVGADLGFHVDDAAHLRQEPRIDLAGIEDLLVGPAKPHRLRHLQDAVRRRRAQCGADRVLVVVAAETFDLDLVEAGETGLEPAQRLLQALLEGAADRHHFADRLHRGGQRVRGAGEFLERKARNLGDDVVDGRLERGRRRTAGDVVGDFIERVADRELGRDLGDRKSRGLRGQRGRTRHARIHLDHDHAAVGRIEAELHVGAAGLHPDLAQHRDRGVAHDLVFLVGERQRRRDGDGIAGVHAHRIEVLDRADDDAIVLLVAHHLHLEFLPAEDAFLDQDFVGRGGIEPALDDVEKFFLVVGDAAAGAAHREGRPDDRGQPDLGQRHQRFAERMLLVALAAFVLAERPLPFEFRQRLAGDLLPFGVVFVAVGLLQRRRIGEPRLRRLQPDLGHGLAEQLAVFRLVDRIRRGADHLDVEFLQRALPAQRQGAVQRGLAAHGRQQRKAAGNDIAFLLDDLGDDLRRDRLDIGRIRQLRIGHDRRRVGIDQDDAIALFLQRLDRLRAGIIEFAGLADHDGTGADDQDGGDVGSFGHQVSRDGQNWAQKRARRPRVPLNRQA